MNFDWPGAAKRTYQDWIPIKSGVAVPVDPILLWSTNTWLKHRIQTQFLSDRHYVWCSPSFESSSKGKYALHGSLPPSSEPATIYRTLKQAIGRSDQHDPKITSQKATISALAVELHVKGTISQDDRDEIIAMVSRATSNDWRPLVFVIPYALVASRVKLVPREQRASQELEYHIADLHGSEFEIIEP